MSIPSVFEYIDPAEWMNNVFSYLKAKDPSFSIRKWCVDLGISNSGTLSSILLGKRKIPLFVVSNIAQKLDLSALEKSYLIFISLAQEGISPSIKRQIQTLFKHQSFIDQADGGMPQLNEEMASTWVAPAIFNGASLDKAGLDKESLLNLLPDQDRSRGEKIIDLFFKKGIFKSDKSKIIPDVEILDYNPHSSQMIRHFHRESILKSLDTLESEQVDKRYFHSTSVVIDSNSLGRFFDVIRNFHMEFLKSNSKAPGDRVYQLNSQLVPITRTKSEVNV